MTPRESWGNVRQVPAPPHNLEAEESVLGSMLLSSDAMAAVIEVCSASDFYKPAHADTFAAIVALFDRGEPVDAITVGDELERVGYDRRLLASLTSRTESIAHAPYHARMVRKDAWRRGLMAAARNIDELAAGGRMEEVVEAVDGLLGELRDARPGRGDDDLQPVDWAGLFDGDDPAAEWLVEPLLPAGRQVALFAPAKVGKSLLALEVGAAGATGRPVLAQPTGEPFPVLYFDLEMTRADLRERLGDLGYGPDDLALLTYYQLVELPPLDTAEGGRCMAHLLDRHGPRLVVVDTMARVVEGPEDSSDTYRAFYRHTGRLLKERGVTLLRADHAGKEPGRGQRGSSAKADDVDVVFGLTAEGDQLRLRRTHSRVPWVPREVLLTRQTTPALRHVVEAGFAPEAVQTARLMDELEVPVDATSAAATAALKAAGQGRRKAVVLDAMKVRRAR